MSQGIARLTLSTPRTALLLLLPPPLQPSLLPLLLLLLLLPKLLLRLFGVRPAHSTIGEHRFEVARRSRRSWKSACLMGCAVAGQCMPHSRFAFKALSISMGGGDDTSGAAGGILPL